MTLRKITIDNSVRCIPVSEQTKEKGIKQNTTKNKKRSEKIQSISGGGKQNKNCSRNNKKFLTNVAASGFGYITNI